MHVSLVAALAFMAGICGRQFQTPTLSGLIQWLVVLAGTGEGKEDGTAGIQALFAEMYEEFGDSIGKYIGPSKFASDKAILVRLNESPCFVSMMGEIGLWLQGLNDPRPNSNYFHLKGTLLDVFGKSGMHQMVFQTKNAKKENSTETTKSPALTLMGDSTPDNYFKALTEADIESGLVTRFIAVPVPDIELPYNPNGRMYRLPETVKNRLRILIRFINGMEQEKRYVVIRETPEANQWQETYARNARRWVKENKDSTIEKIWTRSHLHVMRIGCSVGSRT